MAKNKVIVFYLSSENIVFYYYLWDNVGGVLLQAFYYTKC